MKKKSSLILFSFLLIFTFVYFSKAKDKTKREIASNSTVKNTVKKLDHNSIKKTANNVNTTSISNSETKDNDPEIQDMVSKVKDNISMHLPLEKLKIQYVKEVNFKGNTHSHVIVSYQHPVTYQPFSYEALVDRNTGAIIQTWNRTRYEFKNRVTLNGRNKVYRPTDI